MSLTRTVDFSINLEIKSFTSVAVTLDSDGDIQ